MALVLYVNPVSRIQARPPACARRMSAPLLWLLCVARMPPPIAMSVSYSVHSATSNGAFACFAKDPVVSECGRGGGHWKINMT